jgi:plastocyanin
MSGPIKRHVGFAALAALMLAVLGAATAAGLAAQRASSVKRVTVTEREYRITPSQRSLAAGMTTFVVVNRGKVAHEFEIRGPGVPGKRIAGKLAPGATKMLTVLLRKGSYTLFCPIHVALGMKTAVSVGGAATGGTTTSGTSTKSGWG